MIPYIGRDAIEAAVDYPALIDAMERAMTDFSTGAVIQPVRMRVSDPKAGGDVWLMPAVADVFAIKIVGNYPGNHALGMESHNAVVIVLDRATGMPRAILDGNAITTMRTAAVSAAAARRLATPDARVLTIMGSGVQARSHFAALRLVRDFADVRVWSRDPIKARVFADEIGARALPPEEAIRGADVIATTTSAREPILQGDWLKRGAHISAVGWNGLDGRELDDAVMRNLVLVESREAAATESGNILLSHAQIFAELGDIFAGRVLVDPSDTTVFISVGMAAEDAYAADLVLRRLSAQAVQR